MLSAITPLTTPTDASATARAGLNADYQAFLKLLVAQIQNQDPLEPMDSTTFVTQLAQLTQVEQAMTTNSHLEKISKRMDLSSAFSDVALIGREVSVPSERLSLRAGRAEGDYVFTSAAVVAEAEILDGNGQLIRALPVQVGAPGTPMRFSWNGLDDSGRSLADGAYAFRVRAFDSAGQDVAVRTAARIVVEGVAFQSGGSRLQLADGREVTAADILSVSR
jgi:flagellar basal-body rod modification protein FlgD